MTSPIASYAAVLLTGGTGARLGGVDKSGLELRGHTLLERALAALVEARQIVIVGPVVPLPARPHPATRSAPPITFAQEDPPGGGPAAGLLAGRDALTDAEGLVVVLAVDMPGVTKATLTRLAEAITDDDDGAFLAGPDSRRQLAGLVRISALDGIRPQRDEANGLPMHRLLDPLKLVLVPAAAAEGTDVDTWADLSQHREGLPNLES